MNRKYNIIKFLEKKDSRFVALIQYGSSEAVLKKITTKNKSLNNKFLNEIFTLKNIRKDYVPKLYEYGHDYIIMEYFDALDNSPDSFITIMNESLIEQVVNKLIDLNLTEIRIQNKPRMVLLDLLLIFLKQLKNKDFRAYYFKLILLMPYFYFKNKKLFAQKASTKGDMTEYNLLISNGEIKFIDFDSYSYYGFWLEDASYLLLHQDVLVERLLWQKDFYKKYINAIKKRGIYINKEYIRFWLLYTSIRQFAIRSHQYRIGLASKEQYNLKEEHVRYFLSDNFFNKFLQDIGL